MTISAFIIQKKYLFLEHEKACYYNFKFVDYMSHMGK